MKKLVVVVFIGVFLFSSMAYATLWNRGGGLIYDDVLNITWLQDANYAATSGYWESLDKTAYDAWVLDYPGKMTWWDAMDWADQLEYAGYDDWRLPDKHDQAGSLNIGFNITDSEMGHMYYNNLNGSAEGPFPGATFIDGNGESLQFDNLHDLYYPWLGTEWDQIQAYHHSFHDGWQGITNKEGYNMAWAVRYGDSAPIPEPATMLLLGSGLIGLAGVGRKKLKN